MAERMRAARCEVALEMWPRMPHVWHLFAAMMPEARRAIAGVGRFVRERTEVRSGTEITSAEPAPVFRRR